VIGTFRRAAYDGRVIPPRSPRPGLLLAAATITAAFCALAGCGGDSDSDSASVSGDGGIDLEAGERTYMDFCGSCHGRDFEGSAAGPSQLDAVFAAEATTDEDYRNAITRGAPQENYDFTAMPPIGSLDDAEVENVIAFIRSVQDERGFND
jgi:mono/diheme cytochrome c family protein